MTGVCVEPEKSRLAQLLETVSASRLNCFHSCRLKFYFRYVLELAKPVISALFVGRAVHGALQRWSNARWRGQPLDTENLKTSFVLDWASAQAIEPVEWESQDEENEQQEKAWGLVEMYLRETPIPANEKPEAVEGGFPNWRQVVPSSRRTDITFPQDRSFPELLKRFPAGSDKDKGILLVHERGVVSFQDPAGNSSASLPGATATDPTSALHFRNEGRQLIVMPIRREIQQPQTRPEQPNPMTATTTNGTTGPHINGTHPVPTHGSERPTAIAPEFNKPAIEAAIDNVSSGHP